MSVEFTVSQEALAVVRNTVIEANFDECEAALTEMMAPYKTMVVTEDGIVAAKTDRANIRKVAGRIDEMRKVVKKAYSEPLKAFEDRCKALVAIVDEGATNLDIQIKEFEEREKLDKVLKLQQFYADSADDEVKTYCPFEVIANAKWANKSYSVEQAQGEIESAIVAARNDISVIREMGGDDVAYLLDYYKQTHELSAVIRKASELKTLREQEAARQREAEAIQQAAHAPVIESDGIPLVTVTFKVTCTKHQLKDLGEYMKLRGIQYGRA